MALRERRSNLEQQHNHQIIISSDGSHTIYLPDLEETYHSSHGAIAESQHIYINHGLHTMQQLDVKILEVGFGTGLNALLTYQYAKRNSLKVHYDALEPFPLTHAIFSQLNYGEKLGDMEIFQGMHRAANAETYNPTSSFSFSKYLNTIQDFQPTTTYDLIYFDAFAPSKQAEMWHLEIFEKLFLCLNVGGILMSYCASGQFKRDLKKSGFEIEILEGPPPKKQITRARKRGEK